MGRGPCWLQSPWSCLQRLSRPKEAVAVGLWGPCPRSWPAEPLLAPLMGRAIMVCAYRVLSTARHCSEPFTSISALNVHRDSLRASEGLSHIRLFATPMDYTVHGILQARILQWVAIPFSRGSSQPRDQTQVSHIAGGFFTS